MGVTKSRLRINKAGTVTVSEESWVEGKMTESTKFTGYYVSDGIQPKGVGVKSSGLISKSRETIDIHNAIHQRSWTEEATDKFPEMSVTEILRYDGDDLVSITTTKINIKFMRSY